MICIAKLNCWQKIESRFIKKTLIGLIYNWKVMIDVQLFDVFHIIILLHIQKSHKILFVFVFGFSLLVVVITKKINIHS